MPQNIKNSASSDSRYSSYKHSKCILLSLLFLTIGIAAGLAIYKTAPSVTQNAVNKGSYDDGYKAALDFARQKIQQKGILIENNGSNVPKATVKSVNGNIISVDIDATLLDFFAEGVAIKTITITDSTKIEQLTPKSADQFSKEQADFIKYSENPRKGETKTQDNQMTPPSPFETKELKPGDLKEGDIISFSGNGDLSKTDSMEVNYISLH